MLTTEQIVYRFILTLLSITIAVFAATRWRRRRTSPTAGTGALLLWCAALWIMANAFELASTDPQIALNWNKLQYIASAPISILWFVLALQFSGNGHRLTRRHLLMIASVPFVLHIVLFTDNYSSLYLVQSHVEIRNAVANVVPEPGPFMILAYLYAYAGILLGCYLVMKTVGARGYRWQGRVLLLSALFVIAANILDWTRLNPIPQVKLSPLALTLIVPIFVATILRARRADVVTITRANVIQNMQDAVLVLDAENLVLDMNPAAEAIVGHRLAAVTGKPIAEVWPEWLSQTNVLSQNPESGHRIQLGEGDQARILDLRQSELNDWRGQLLSRVVVLRDVTEQAHAEQALRTSEDQFRALTENATDSVFVMSDQAIVTYASPSIEKTFGFTASELVGQSALDFVHPDDFGLALTALTAAADSPGTATPIIIRIRQATGGWRKLESTINNLLDHPTLKGIVINSRDVTDRAEAEEKLRLSEEHFRALTENATDSVVVINDEAVISYASPSIEKTFGFPVSEILGKTALEFIHPDDLGIVMTALAVAADSLGKAAPIIARFRQADGSWRKLECTANNLLDHATIKGIVVNARDVTERVEAEEKLRLSEEYFRALTEHSTDVTIIAGTDGNIQYVSPSLERILGIKLDDVRGKLPTEFIHSDDIGLLSETLFKLLHEQAPSATITARARDTSGNWHVMELMVRNLLDHPAVHGIIVNARDVTERVEAEEKLRLSEEYFRALTEYSSDVTVITDIDGTLQYASPSLERIFGITNDNILGKQPFEFVHPDDLEHLTTSLTDNLLNMKTSASTTARARDTSGSWHVLEFMARNMLEHPAIKGIVVNARDVTERVQAEDQVRQSLIEKEILLKEIHHRVKNNLQIIASLLSLQSSAADNPLVVTQFQDSQNRVRTMALIHERLYRSDDLAHIDFGTYLRDLTGYLLTSYEAQGAKVGLTVEADPIQLDIDTAIPCGLLVNEMVSNALKHAFPEGRAGAIGVEMRCIDESHYRLSVRDDGVGLPANVNHRMTSSLGLQLVNSLTRQLGGTVEVETAPGTKFTVCFPKAAAHQSVRVENAQ